jgi:hypothetical protein
MKPSKEPVRPGKVSRREFFKRSAFVAGSAALAGAPLSGAEESQAPAEEKVRVVVVTSPRVIDRDQPVQEDVLREMLKQGLCALTGKNEAAAAWKVFIRPTDAVCVNEAGTWLANVPEVLAEVVQGVAQAFPRSLKLAYYGHQSAEWVATMKQLLQARGISPTVMDGSLISRLSTEPFTVLVMVPTLKSHTVSGVSGVVKHFATLSQEGPAPHHPDAMHTAGSVIVPQFGHLRKLIIVDALRFGETTKGPSYYQKSLIFGTDPVAVDTIALDLFLEHCKPHGTLPPRYHIEAADKEFHAGTSDRNKIEVQRLTV